MNKRAPISILAALQIIIFSIVGSSQEKFPETVRPGRLRPVRPVDIIYKSQIKHEAAEIFEVYIMSREGLYIPCIIMKPKTNDRNFPAIAMIHGGGAGLGMNWLRQQIQYKGMMTDRFVNEGFVCVFMDCRANQTGNIIGDIEEPSDTADIISVIRYTKSLPYVDSENVFISGESLGGGLSMKAIPIEPVKAAILNAPAAYSFIGMQEFAGRSSPNTPLDSDFKVTDEMIDKELAKNNFTAINCPILFNVGSEDFLLEIIKKVHALMIEFGKDASIDIYQGEHHGFQPGPMRNSGEEYKPSQEFLRSLDNAVKFFKSHL